MGSIVANSKFLVPDSLAKLVKRLAAQGPFKCLETPKRVRLMFNGAIVADTHSALYVWEHEFYPQFYLPLNSFKPADGFEVSLNYGDPIVDDHDKIVGGGLQLAVRRRGGNEEFRIVDEMVIFASELEGPASPLSDYVKVVFGAVDQWFEDDVPIYVHPKDPYKRVDCNQSLTPIRVTVPVGDKDIILAESQYSIVLYETMLPPRYYLPYTSINTIYLRPSTSISECPYKGVAQYHHVVVKDHELKDLVWWYRAPTAECLAVTGLRCFYNEKVDIWKYIDGSWEKSERPVTHFA